MSESVWQWPLERFLDAAASAAPTPGGGSVGAVTGALGLALVIMGLEVTAKGGAEGEAAALAAEARPLLGRIREHADADIHAFEEIMAAYRLPKGTDDEKSARREAIQRATATATEAPLASARDVVAGIALAERAARVTKAQVISDTAAGVDLMSAAVTGILHNVDINLGALADRDAADRYAAEREALASSAAKHAEAARAAIAGR